MREFEISLVERIRAAESASSAARLVGDEFSAAVFNADADELRGLANDHGVQVITLPSPAPQEQSDPVDSAVRSAVP